MDTHEPIHPATPYTSSTTAVRSTAVVQHSTQQKKSIQQQATNPQCVYDNGTAAQQYHGSTAENTRNYSYARDRGRYSGQPPPPKKKNTDCSGTLNYARAWPVWRFLLLHAPLSPSTYTAVHVYSGRYHTAEHALVQSLFLCRAGMYSSTCVGTGTVLGFPFFYYYPPSRGASDSSPGEPLDAPRSPSRSSVPVLSPGPQRAAVWGGRGAPARAREPKWRSGVAAVFGVCYNRHIFKDVVGHHYYHYRFRAALYIAFQQ